MAENETERLLSDTKTRQESQERLTEKGYVPCEEHAETDCEKCFGNRPTKEFETECDCGGECNKCRPVKKSRANRICGGAASVLGGWPNQIIYAVLFVLCVVILLVFLITVIVIMLLQHYHHHHQPKTAGLTKRHSLCKEITKENISLFIMGYAEGSTEKAKRYLDPTRNIFYVIGKPLTEEQACNIESLLRLMTDKLVYVLEFFDKSAPKTKDYVRFLQRRYTNLNRISTNRTHYFEGSMFANISNVNRGAPLSILAAKVLAVWQFGGMALSENIILNSRDIIDNSRDICFSDRDVIYCPQECSAYSFELMRVILNEIKSNDYHKNIENIIDRSVDIYCGSNEAAKTGCNRVYRLKESDMCEGNSGACQFIRMKLFKQLMNSEEIRHKFCPYILRQ